MLTPICSHFQASPFVFASSIEPCGLSSDIVLELQSSGRLLAGKDECDPFAAALVQGLCAKIKGLEGFNAMRAVEIKTAAETALPMVFQTSVGKAIEEEPFGYTNM